MDIAVVTSLFPLPARPREGVFAARRWRGMADRGHRVRIVHPLPWTPPRPFDRLLDPARRELGRAPRSESDPAWELERPRYLHLPRQALGNARRFAAASTRSMGAWSDPPEVVICDYAWPAAEITTTLVPNGVPVVLHGRGSDVLEVREHPELSQRLSAALRRAGHWCAVSDDLVAAMDELGGRPGHGRTTPNGVDMELFRPGSRPEARAALELPADGPLVLVVGHLIARKRPLLALQCFLEAAPDDARLAFVGRGPLSDELERAIEASGAAGRIRTVGEADPDQLATWYRAADVLLLASNREGRPNVVLEALASGLPVVASAAGGTPELLGGFTSALAPVDDGGALARALRTTLESPPSADACLRAVAPYSWAAGLERLEDQLRRAVESKS